MKVSANTLFLFFGILGLGLLQSCKDDNDDPNPSPSSPNTLTFSNIDHVEFRMFTNGAEVNTGGLSIENYMDSEYYNSISSAHFQSQAGLTFKDDSLFSEMDGLIVGYPYHILNDSIYLNFSFPVEGGEPILWDLFFGMGNVNALYIPHRYYRMVVNSENFSSETDFLDIGTYSFDEVKDEIGMGSLSEIDENDTLIIYNQRANYN